MGAASGPDIVQDGLVLCLDAADGQSYPSTGTIWFDLAGSNNVTNCNLQLSRNGKFSLFSNGNNADTPSSAILNNDVHTIEFVIMFKNTVSYPNGWTGAWEQFFGYYGSGSDRTPGIWRYPAQRLIHWRYDPNNTGIDFGKNSSSQDFDLNTYYHAVVTKNGANAVAYVNGVQVVATTVSNPKTAGDSIARFYYYYTADLLEIQICKIYNRALTPSEVLQNYNAIKGRFGI